MTPRKSSPNDNAATQTVSQNLEFIFTSCLGGTQLAVVAKSRNPAAMPHAVPVKGTPLCKTTINDREIY